MACLAGGERRGQQRQGQRTEHTAARENLQRSEKAKSGQIWHPFMEKESGPYHG
jgi:hypothetical protein